MMAILDTDALLGLAYRLDAHHENAKIILEHFSLHGVDLLLLPTVLSEFSLIATSRIGMTQTKRAVTDFVRMSGQLIPITNDMTDQAIALYQSQTSKEDSLFDCYVVVAAKLYRADCVFSFDGMYRKNGLILAKDFVQQLIK